MCSFVCLHPSNQYQSAGELKSEAVNTVYHDGSFKGVENKQSGTRSLPSQYTDMQWHRQNIRKWMNWGVYMPQYQTIRQWEHIQISYTSHRWCLKGLFSWHFSFKGTFALVFEHQTIHFVICIDFKSQDENAVYPGRLSVQLIRSVYRFCTSMSHYCTFYDHYVPRIGKLEQL